MLMYRLIVDNKMEIVFPNTWIALRIYLSLMISYCSGERSFSKLRRINNELRSCMTHDRTAQRGKRDSSRNIDVSSFCSPVGIILIRPLLALETETHCRIYGTDLVQMLANSVVSSLYNLYVYIIIVTVIVIVMQDCIDQ